MISKSDWVTNRTYLSPIFKNPVQALFINFACIVIKTVFLKRKNILLKLHSILTKICLATCVYVSPNPKSWQQSYNCLSAIGIQWHSGKEPACLCRRCKRCRFNPWVGKIPCGRKGQLTPVFLPGEFHGQRSLEGYSPWSCKESDTTEWLSTHTHNMYIKKK